MKVKKSTGNIAIIGMGCYYPGARNLQQFWENILAKRRQFRPIPEKRLPLSEYYNPDPQTPDKTYLNKAAVIDGFEFDWASKRIPKTTFESTDIVHWLALEVALDAIEDAGYTRENIPTERSGVLLGNSLTGEQTRSHTMRLRWPYVERTLRAAAKTKDISPSKLEDLLQTMEAYYKSVFPPVSEDWLAGGLSNTIAGRICNFLDFHGGGYVTDGACSSSLLAVANAATALANGDLDLALAGGVDISLDTFEIIGFAKTGALTREDMTVYDRRASGFIPGEGCGFVLLKRLEDARADGDYLYAVLRGWGISSDGKGGITAPSKTGQARALRRAYERAGYNPDELAFIEGHGTGTPVGDRVEIEAIALAMNDRGETNKRICGLTSLKSIVGHTKAAAGIGGLIKAAIAVNQRILPPTAGCKVPNPIFETTASGLYPIVFGEIRNPTENLRAGVSAMGFGGINCHVTLESGDAPASHLKTSIDERALMVSNQDTELFIFSAASISELHQHIQNAIAQVAGISEAELVDLAAHLAGELNSQLPVRAAVISGKPEEFLARLQQLEEMLRSNPPAIGEIAISPEQEIWIGNAVVRNRIGFLFPGQGSQKINMARTLVERYSWARELVEQADIWLTELGAQPIGQFMYRRLDSVTNEEEKQEWLKALSRTEITQPAICLASLIWMHYLARLGIKPVVVGGHSLGELTAFHAAGAFDEKTLLCLASVRGRSMSVVEDNVGTMAALNCSQEVTENLLKQVSGYVVVANVNSPQQTVISGESASVEAAIKIANLQNIEAHQLPVSNAFHSQIVAKAAEEMRIYASVPEVLDNLSVELFSSVNGQKIEPGWNLREHFANQVVERVNFISLCQAIAQRCDLMVEVGSRKVLSGLVNQIIKNATPLCFPIEANKLGIERELNTFLACLFASGGEVYWEAFYENRLIRPFIPASQRLFIDNPLERPFDESAIAIPPLKSINGNKQPSAAVATSQSQMENSLARISDDNLLGLLSNYFQQRGQFLADVIRADIQNLSPFLLQYKDTATHSNFPLCQPSAEREITSKSTVFPSSIPPSLEEIKPEIISTEDSNLTNSTAAFLIELVSQRTGYRSETIGLQARLLDDLNMDSIKAGELIASAAKECGVAGKIDPSSLANATLQEIVDALLKVSSDANKTTANNTVTSKSKIEASSSALLLEIIEQRTGFSKHSLSMEMRLLDNLNLDSIKAGESIAEVTKRLGIAGLIQPGQLANATLGEIVAVLEQTVKENQYSIPSTSLQNNQNHPGTVTKISTLDVRKSWVRNFRTEYEEKQLPSADNQTQKWEETNFIILGEPEALNLAQALSNELKNLKARVQNYSFTEVRQQQLASTQEFTHFIALFSPIPNSTLPPRERLQLAIERLNTVASLAVGGNKTIAYVQFNEDFSSIESQKIADIECSCTQAFAASVHLERPELKIRSLTVSSTIESNLIAPHILKELSTPDAYATAIYNSDLQRRVPLLKVQEPSSYPKRNLSWSLDDVILVTGGAKGITAECALAFARSTGVQMALVGSSPHPDRDGSVEIANTLERFTNERLTCRYYQCDITDVDALKSLVQQINQELGAITGVIHGAAINKPRRVEQVSLEAAFSEVAPKVLGAIALCDALKETPPKLFAGLASIIGVTGMAGNAWYAFSNETLDSILRCFGATHPQTAVISIAFSVWEEVGMGARMGSVRNLAKLGIGAIPTDEGVQRFVQLLERDPGSRSIVVASRLGELDTWRSQKVPFPTASRFLERVISYEPNVEVISRVHLTLKHDLYLQDHVWKGSYLFPTVFGLEAMAQAVACVTGLSDFSSLRIEDINLDRPIVVDSEKGLNIEIRAEAMEGNSANTGRKVSAIITTEQTGFAIPHFSATFVLDIEDEAPSETIELPVFPLDIQVQHELYGNWLFQGPLFQRLQNIYSLECHANWTGKSIFTAEIRSYSLAATDGFSPEKSMPLILGDPFFRDSLLQAGQVVLGSQDICLPIHIERLDLYQPNRNFSGFRKTVAFLQGRSAQESRFLIFALDEEGRILEKISGLKCKIVEHHADRLNRQQFAESYYQEDEMLLRQELIKRSKLLNVAVPDFSFTYHPGLHLIPKDERHQLELPELRKAVLRALKTNTLGS